MSPDQAPQPHVLDRIVWNSLTTYHANFAVGTALAKRYPADMGPFAAILDHSDAAQHDLEQIVAPGEVLFIDGVQQASDLPGWTMLAAFDAYQMLHDQPIDVLENHQPILELGAADVPDILRLIELAQPGPFLPRTIEFGRYIGLRHHGQLTAMAGERLHLPGYHEVSAVCTHPDFRGRGHARLLVSEMVAGHRRQGEISFLHVDVENTSAFRLYESMGFRIRITAHAVVMQR